LSKSWRTNCAETAERIEVVGLWLGYHRRRNVLFQGSGYSPKVKVLST